MTPKNPVVLFDGVCNLCNASVKFILKYEKNKELSFAPIQSKNAQLLLENFKSEKISDTVLLIENSHLYQSSTAALRIARRLRYFRILYVLIYLPAFIRDPFYRLIAKNRYSWFGKKGSCMIPDKNQKGRFI